MHKNARITPCVAPISRPADTPVNAESGALRAGFGNARVLVTGGLGFIGSNLALRMCETGAAVTLLDNLAPSYGGNRFNIAPIARQAEVIIGDMRDERLMHELVARHDYLFNLAGQTSHIDSMQDPQQDLEANVRAQLAVLEACRKVNPGIRVVFASTRQVYGKPAYLPVDEAHPLNPVDVNGVHKIAGEMYHQLYAQVYGLATTVLRLTNTYGPRMRVRDDRQTFLGTWIRRLLDGETLQVFGDGRQLRDFNYVDDVVRALMLCALARDTAGKVYNLGSSEVLSLEALAQKLVATHGSGSYELVAFPDERKRIDIGDYFGSSARIEHDLGWQAQVGLDAGLRQTLDYFGRFGGHYWP
jgi:UDP-glucose 4-epimerase